MSSLGEKNNTLKWCDYRHVVRQEVRHRTKLILPSCSTNDGTLYQLAADKAGLTGDEEVDAYSGIGTISLTIADRAAVCLRRSCTWCRRWCQSNADINGVNNAKFELARLKRRWLNGTEAGMRPDVIFVDPPRKGLTPELIDAVTGMEKPEKFSTLAVTQQLWHAWHAVQILENGYHIQGQFNQLTTSDDNNIESVTLCSLRTNFKN